MAIKPLVLTPLSAEQLQANNLLCGRSAEFASQVHGQPVTFALTPDYRSESLDLTLILRIEGIDTSLQLSRSFFSGITIGNTIIGDVIDQLPEPLLMGSLHLIFERTLSDLKALLQKDIQLQQVRFSTEPLTASLAIKLTMNKQTHVGRIGIHAQNKAWIEALPATSPTTSPRTSLTKLPIAVTFEAGRTTLSSHQLHQLCPHDIIFFDHSWHNDHSHLFIKLSANSGFLAHLAEQTVTLKDPMEAPMSDDIDALDDFDEMDDLDNDLDDLDAMLDDEEDNETPSETTSTAQAPAATTAPDINAIPVQLTFDIGKQDIPLGNMSQLVPGFTFQLNRSLASPVIIHANGQALAEGELVDVNGQLGTRITKML